MVAVQGEVHGLLAFQAGILRVVCATFGLQLERLFGGVAFVQVFINGAVAVFPVVAAVIDAFERNLVVGVEFVVEGERVALAFARHIVLAHLGFFHYYLVVVYVIFELCVVRAAGGILVRARNHQAQFVVEETVTVSQAQVYLCLFADSVVAATGCGVEDTAVRGVLGDEGDASADGITVHVGCYHFVYLNGLHHVGGDEVELYVTCVAFGRGDAVAVDGYGAEVGARAAHLAEAGFTLVVLHVDAADALQGVADVRVGELAYLVGRHHVGNAQVALLRRKGAALAGEGAAYHDFLQLQAFVQRKVFFNRLAFGDGDGHFHGRVAYVSHFYLISARFQVGEGVETVYVARHAGMQLLDVDGSARQDLLGVVHDAAADGSLFGFVVDFVGPQGWADGQDSEK